MRWSAAIMLAALLAAGCNNTAPSTDPFAPRLLPSTRVPPPATGAAGAVDSSYYNSPTPGPLPTPGPAALPPGTGSDGGASANGPFRANPPGASSFTPNQSSSLPDSFHRPSSRTHGRMVDRSVVPASHVTDASSTPYADDEDEDDEDEQEEEPHASGLQPTSARFPTSSGSSGAVDIMDLPPVRRAR